MPIIVHHPLPTTMQAGNTYAPPGGRHVVYFLDDLNLPRLDAYETSMPLSLVRQHLATGQWYDRAKLLPKIITNTQCVGFHDVDYLMTLTHNSDCLTQIRGVHEPSSGLVCSQPPPSAAVPHPGHAVPWAGLPDDDLWHLCAQPPQAIQQRDPGARMIVMHKELQSTCYAIS